MRVINIFKLVKFLVLLINIFILGTFSSYAQDVQENQSNQQSTSTNVNNQEPKTQEPATDANSQKKSTEEQLKGYQQITNWLIDNEKNFEDVIKENAVETKTKWFVEEDYEKKKLEEEKKANTVEAQPVENSQKIFHLVKKGDTLYSLSKYYNVNQQDILKWNSLNGAEDIQLGKVLTIYSGQPTSTEQNKTDVSNSTVTPVQNNDNTKTSNLNNKESEQTFNSDKLPEYKYYRVKKGDTFSSIAKSNYMSKEELFALNNFDDNAVLSVDQIVKVKSNYGGNNKQDTSAIVKDGFIWPVVGRLLMAFGTQEQGLVNEGINILAKKGTSVKATQEGIVIYVGNSLKSFGNLVLVQHDKHWISAYAHMGVVNVNKGQKVLKNEVIGKVGDSGDVNTPQLHFELRYNIKPVDPLNYLVSYR